MAAAHAESHLDPHRDARWYEISLNAAEAACRYGWQAEALRIVEGLRHAPRRTWIPQARMEALEAQIAAWLDDQASF